MGNHFQKKPRILCLHGHGSSAKILKQQLKKWPEFVLEKMDLVYIDGPLRTDQSGLIGKFDPPYYEWYKDYEGNKYFDEAIAYIEEQMIMLGPFDGVLGVSQGACVTGTLPGMQKQGVALTKVPKIKFVIIISGAKIGGGLFSSPELAKTAFSSPIDIPSVHVVGEKDIYIPPQYQFELMESFVRPTLLYHHGGHGVTVLDDNGVKIVLGFLREIQGIFPDQKKDRTQIERSRMCCFYLDLMAKIFSSDRARVQSLR